MYKWKNLPWNQFRARFIGEKVDFTEFDFLWIWFWFDELPFFSEIRKRSYAETAQFQENFEVYIQALISQCLDSNFLDEVFSDQGTYLKKRNIEWFSRILISFLFTDEYFVSNIEKVDSVTLLRKDKIMNGVSWSLRFQQSINTWPCLNDLGSGSVQVWI